VCRSEEQPAMERLRPLGGSIWDALWHCQGGVLKGVETASTPAGRGLGAFPLEGGDGDEVEAACSG
jgi:hypothetical protein